MACSLDPACSEVWRRAGTWLISARVLQGAGGALLAPATLSLLTTTFSEPAERRRALGAWSATAASGAAAGVLAGGILTDLLDWRWVLLVNVAIGIALMAGAFWALPRSPRTVAVRRLDVPGVVSVTVGLAMLVYGIVGTDTHPWASAWTISVLGVAVGFLGVFAVIESRLAQQPLVPLGVFRRRSLSAANGVSLAVGGSLYSVFFFMSLYLQQINHYTPLRAGLAFLPIALSSLCAALGLQTGRPYRSAPPAHNRADAGRSGFGVADTADTRRQLLVRCAAARSPRRHRFRPVVRTYDPGRHRQRPSVRGGSAVRIVITTRQVGGAIGLAATAAAAAAAVHTHSTAHYGVAGALTSGYDRAFGISAAVLIAGALVAIALPGKLGSEQVRPPPRSARRQRRWLLTCERRTGSCDESRTIDLGRQMP